MPCLLLDVDGVILRDERLFRHLRHNAARYVAKKLPECEDPIETNKFLYLTHGHTALGLKNAFGIDASDFNEFVYDKSLMTHLSNVIDSKKFRLDAETIHSLTERGWPVTLFSNAPYEWLRPIALAINDRVKIRCPGPDTSVAKFKPDPAFYKEFDSCDEYYYVDDSLMNLKTVSGWPNWRPFHFTERKETHLWCPQVSSLPELSLCLATIQSCNMYIPIR
jgi:FMN phosphatase YigB (HAD superfamily)